MNPRASFILFLLLFAFLLNGQSEHDPERAPENHDWWKADKNSLTMMVNELVTGSTGICYERFFQKKQSYGIKSSVYLFGRGYVPLFSYNRSEFTGIKLSPFTVFTITGMIEEEGILKARLYGDISIFQNFIMLIRIPVTVIITTKLPIRWV